jgi:hypothetical protein
MSDLSLHLQQAASQLPVSSYFDSALFEQEMRTLFDPGPRYVGHAQSIPEIGDYITLAHEGEGRALDEPDQHERNMRTNPAEGKRERAAAASGVMASSALMSARWLESSKLTAGRNMKDEGALSAAHASIRPSLYLQFAAACGGTHHSGL